MVTETNNLPRLAADPSGRTLGLDLPPGRLFNETYQGPWPEPLLWLADGRAAPGQWSAQRAARRAAGLVPVLVDVGGPSGDPEGWDLMCGNLSYPEDLGADEMLSHHWGELRGKRSGAAPFDVPWPGLAGAVSSDVDADEQAAGIADALSGGGSWLEEPRLALVSAECNADIPSSIGWAGALHHEDDAGVLSAVLRSWDERFGTRVVAITANRLVLSVASPPTTLDQAVAVAAEHAAFCPDDLDRSPHGTLEEYAGHHVLGRRTWVHHWD
ncbi:hypothetical protein BJP40_23605 [Streptomyces sp. CC53]|uniref:DUF4253 domain-containing protein n=1 Tax=unclassified Streptomyces TaxID=2593676 RepID=UPI0008DEA132|nr:MULTISPECIES: DUF4253 domain-containing protein [unclassified Streptomyces]OII63587.1 hypothetical protein BJP40_23605 [Streptomyces sp. CC53]